jgi:hypothetical protein
VFGTYFFLLLRQKKKDSKKEKAILRQQLRCLKKTLRWFRSSLFSWVALAILPITCWLAHCCYLAFSYFSTAK